MSSTDLELRDAEPADDAFLRRLHASTLPAELQSLANAGAGFELLLDMQYRAKQQHYRVHYPQAEQHLIVWRQTVVGQQTVERHAGRLQLVDLALLPEARGLGIGTQVLQRLQARALAAGVPLQLHVEQHNPAQRLYQRLGFTLSGRAEPYLAMTWQPEPAALARSAHPVSTPDQR